MLLLNDLTEKGKIHALRSGGGANIGSALLTAVETMLQEQDHNKKVIILLVNGDVLFFKNDSTDAQVQRLKDGSYEKIAQARALAEENGITIHSVLLQNLSASNFVQNELRTSDGSFAAVNSSEELPECFTKILANEIKSTVLAANGTAKGTTDIVMNVPNSSVAEMSIIVPLKHLNASSLQLISPNGTVMSENNDFFYSIASPYYAFYKIISPEKGDWHLSSAGDDSNNNITIQYVLEYDLLPVASLAPTNIGKNESINISAAFEKKGDSVKDGDLYRIPASIKVYKEGKLINTAHLSGTNDGYSYTLEPLKEYGAGEYSVNLHFEGDGIVRDIEDLSFTVTNKAPVLMPGSNSNETYSFIINIPGKEETYVVQSHSWDLSKIVYDPDGDRLNWEIISSPEGVTAAITDSTLTITTQKDTPSEGDVVIIPNDTDKEEGPSLVFHINVTDTSASVGTIVYKPTERITKANDSATIRMQYTVNGTTLSTGEYYNIPATITLKKGNTILSSGLAMTYDGSAYSYTFTDLKQYGSGLFEADIRLQSGSYIHDCIPCTFSMENQAPALADNLSSSEIDCTFLINNPESQESYQTQSKIFDLSTYVYDPDGDPITWSIVSNTADVKTTLTGANLTITTKKDIETMGDIVVLATDSDGDAGTNITFHVTAVSIENQLELIVSGPTRDIEKNETITIKAQLTQNRVPIARDSKLYSIPATVSVKKGEEIVYTALPMMNDNGMLSCTIPDLSKYASGEYSVSINITDGNFHMNSQEYSFTLKNSAPSLVSDSIKTISHDFYINDPEDQTSYKIQSWSYDLNELISDADEDPLTWSISGDNTNIKTVIKGSTLTVTTIKDRPANENIIIKVVDSEGVAGPDISAHITVTSVEDDIGIKVTGPVHTVSKNEALIVNAKYTRKDIEVTENDWLNTVPMKLTLLKQGEELERNLTMELKDGQYQYAFDHLSKYGSGVYTVIAKASNGEFQVESPICNFELSNEVPVLINADIASIDHRFEINIPGNDESYQPLTWIVDLDQYATDPNGDVLTWTISDNTASVNAHINRNELEITTRPNQPTEGEITVIPHDAEGENGPAFVIGLTVVSIQDVYNQYTAKIQPIPSTQKNSDIDIVLKVFDEKGTRVINDSYLPAQINAAVYEGEKSTKVLLTRNEENNYSGIFHSGNLSTTYQVTAEVSVGEKSIKPEAITFSTINRTPVTNANISEGVSDTVLLGIGSDKEIDLSVYFSDPDEDTLTYTITDNTLMDHVEFIIDGSTLLIHPKSGNFCFPVSGSFVVIATDNEGAQVIGDFISFTIWPVFPILIVVILLAALIFALLKFTSWKNAQFGNEAFDVSYGYMGLELPDGLSEPLPVGKHTPVELGAYYTVQAEHVVGEHIQKDELNKIMIKPMSKNRIQIVPVEDSACAVFEGRCEYKDNQYSSEKKNEKARVIKPNETISFCNGIYCLNFKLVRIKKNDE